MQKYKVFLNEKRIIFCTPAKITFTKPSINLPDFTDGLAVRQWLNEFEKSTDREYIIESENADEIFLNFKDSLINMDAAGGVVKKEGRLLFIFRNDKWDLPKGKIDKDETPEEASLREVEEECGIKDHRITESLNPSFHIYRSLYKESKDEWILKKTSWFEMHYDGVDAGTPETDEGITEIRWFEPSELDEVLQNTYANLKEIIESYFV